DSGEKPFTLTGEDDEPSTWTPLLRSGGALSSTGPFCALASRPRPVHVGASRSTPMGPFCAVSLTSPACPRRLIGPLTADASTTPPTPASEMGPLSVRRVK